MANPPPYHPQRQIAKKQEKTVTIFEDTHGSPIVRVECTQTTGPSPDADVDTVVEHKYRELACGCTWPFVKASGRCSECGKAGLDNPMVCVSHHVVCPGCGASVCWKHSRTFPDEKGVRFCQRCYSRERSKASLRSIGSVVARIARAIFFKQTRDK